MRSMLTTCGQVHQTAFQNEQGANQSRYLVCASNASSAQVEVEEREVEIAPWKTHTFFSYNGNPISPWHDIPLAAGTTPEGDKLFHFVCEIPKGTVAKMEIHKSFEWNPIVQDTKKGKLREYKYNPEVGSLCNYGALTQTWEDPLTKHPDTGAGGDNDPIDVLQINEKACTVGQVFKVRVLGTLAMVDDGETDWKLIVVDDADDTTKNLRDIGDVPEEKVNSLREWFRLYKTAEGKGENKFGLDEKAMDKEYTVPVVMETHEHYLSMMGKKPTKNLFEKIMGKVDNLIKLAGIDKMIGLDAGKEEEPWKKKKCEFDGEPCWLGEGEIGEKL
jgi:inorganic pyrophosphatase